MRTHHAHDYQPEKNVTFKITNLVVLLLLTFLLGWLVGQMVPVERDPAPPPVTRVDPPATIPANVHATNAQNYADWCGGYVQTIGDDRTVVGCDR